MRDLTGTLLPTLVLLAAAGCGGAGDDPGSSPAAANAASTATDVRGVVHACDLLTAADVEALFGAPARPMEDMNREAQCGFWAPETGLSGITLRLGRGAEFQGSWASDNMRATSEVVDVDDLGDGAVWVADMNMLAVLVEDRTLVLVGTGDLAIKRQLMERILAHR